MRVAAIYDIHGNLPALEAVLEEIDRADVDRIVVGGDVLPGPMPRETIDRLLSLDTAAQFIRGNGDREVLAWRGGTGSDAVPPAFHEVMRWVARELSPEDERLLASWPMTGRLRIDELGEVLFCHATPRSDTEIFTQLTPEDRLVPIFDETEAAMVVCGHTHMQFDRTVGNIRVLNAGSVGMPFGEPGAYWLLLGPGVEFRRTVYDFANAAERIRNTRYPQAAEFAARNVLQPPSKADMLKAFTRADPLIPAGPPTASTIRAR